LYCQFAAYQFENLQDRFRDVNESMHTRRCENSYLDTLCLKRFIREQIVLQHMDKEIVEDEKVEKGVIGGGHSGSGIFTLRGPFI
jgi:hypothetical protein